MHTRQNRVLGLRFYICLHAVIGSFFLFTVLPYSLRRFSETEHVSHPMFFVIREIPVNDMHPSMHRFAITPEKSRTSTRVRTSIGWHACWLVDGRAGGTLDIDVER